MNNTHQSEKLALNFSTLNYWSKGRIDEALDCYFHRQTFKSDALLDGTAFHEMWEREIKRTNLLKIGNTVVKFNKPQCEKKIETSYNDRWDIHGTFDVWDPPILYEFKSGKTKGLDFAGTMQIPLYFLISELIGVPLEKAILLHYDQHRKKTEYIVIWNNDKKVMGARNWFETLAGEIEDYFEKHNIKGVRNL